MPRPCKCRRIAQEYGIGFFGPKGIPIRELELVVLTHEEVEALRLVDLEGMYQENAASRMGISRPTLSRILEIARRKLVDALIGGKGLQVTGGNYRAGERTSILQDRQRCWGARARDKTALTRKE